MRKQRWLQDPSPVLQPIRLLLTIVNLFLFVLALAGFIPIEVSVAAIVVSSVFLISLFLFFVVRNRIRS